MLKVVKVITLILAMLWLSSCSKSPATPSPVKLTSPTGQAGPVLTLPNPTPSSSASTSPTPINTISSPTVTSSPVPSTPSSTPTPAGLNATGPYVMYMGHGGIWISNPDGSFPTQLSKYEVTNTLDLHTMVSPSGDQMALVVGNDQGLDLELIQIPSGETKTLAHLIDAVPPQDYDPTSTNSFATYAIDDYNSVAWQPGDGRLLAFIGAINGPTADLYLYDTQTGEITQLTDGPSQAIEPIWSPDGQYILHFGVSWVPPFGGAIVGPTRFDGVWAVNASNGDVITLPKNKGVFPHFIGWQDDSHYITFDSGECSSENLHTVDVVTGKTSPLMEPSFYSYIAQSPENGAILFSSADGCAGSLGEGIFLLPAGQASPQKLRDTRAWEIDWLPESQVFFAYPEGLYSSDGQTFYTPALYNKSYHPALSKAGYQAWVVIENYQPRAEIKIPNGDWQTIIYDRVTGIIWDPLGGKTLLITLEDGSLYAASSPEFKPELKGNLGDDVLQVIWTP